MPDYRFDILLCGERIGEINLRIGYTEGLYWGGQLGYSVNTGHRGNGYAAAACRLALRVAKAHGMKKLLITNDIHNTASRRVCEKLGARYIRTARLPESTDLFAEGNRYINIYELSVN